MSNLAKQTKMMQGDSHGDCCCCAENLVLFEKAHLHSEAGMTASEFSSRRGVGNTCVGLTMQMTAAKNADPRLVAVLKIRQRCEEIAEENPEKPVTAIAEASWNNDPILMSGDAVAGFTSHIFEVFGPVITFLTFANVNVIETDVGYILVDCGTRIVAAMLEDSIEEVRKRNNTPRKPVVAAIYTHGHVDHCMFNFTGFDDPEKNFGVKPQVIAHENCPKRFERYMITNGYNTTINARQFRLPKAFKFEDEFRFPDRTYRDFLSLEIGGRKLELHHGMGETDDATMVWLPEERFAFVGDFFIWNTPNCGNPQKVQRYPIGWIQALEKVQSWNPKILFPGHGPPIIGEKRVAQALDETIRLLKSITEPTLELINAGKDLTFIMNNVRGDQQLMKRPYLVNRYDDDRFIVANLWRHFAGWYTQEITRLLPVEKSSVAKELSKLVEPQALAEHALSVLGRQETDENACAIALELVELAVNADPGNTQIHLARSQILHAYAEQEPCRMAESIFRSGALESDGAVAGSPSGL